MDTTWCDIQLSKSGQSKGCRSRSTNKRIITIVPVCLLYSLPSLISSLKVFLSEVPWLSEIYVDDL